MSNNCQLCYNSSLILLPVEIYDELKHVCQACYCKLFNLPSIVKTTLKGRPRKIKEKKIFGERRTKYMFDYNGSTYLVATHQEIAEKIGVEYNTLRGFLYRKQTNPDYKSRNYPQLTNLVITNV